MVRVPPSTHVPDPLLDIRRLSPRDRLILSWLAEHYVLSTEQIASALFPSLRAAQERLTLLYRIQAVSRFSFARGEGESGSYRYTLGPLGVHLHPTAFTDPDTPTAKPPRTHLERRARIMRSPRLNHLMGVNQFFIDLITHARHHPEAELRRWWSEQHATDSFAGRTSRIRPDGHGIWRVGSHEVGLFVEHDNSTENVPTVLKKLVHYERLAIDDGGPRYPVLLWVPDRRREANLLRVLAGTPTAMTVATGVHGGNPAGPVWALPGDPGPRFHLHELPSAHGPSTATNLPQR